MAQRASWFCDARFGMFVHWGLYSIPARGEWVMQAEKIPAEAYERYFTQFDPAAFDPGAWARAAKQAGMRYIVLTAKHHDGFCLFDSSLTEYKSTNTKAGRDLVRAFLDAARAEGLRVGLYYSLLDWHHPDYPKYSDENHPLYQNPAYADDTYDFDRYLAYMHGQVEELVTGYGKLDLMWFDFSYGEMTGEKWRATRLVQMIRRHQPDILINNRLDTSGAGLGGHDAEVPPSYCGDFVSPEQAIPLEGLQNARGGPVLWEACLTMNNSWGYRLSDRDYKPAGLLVHKLVDCVSKGGNMILNVGPDANGRFPAEANKLLEELGEWMRRNGDSVYGCTDAGLPRPEWGRYTQNGAVLYAHLFEPPIGPIPLVGIPPEKIKTVHLLADGSEVRSAHAALICRHGSPYRYVSLWDNPNHTRPLPDAWDTVLEIRLDD